MKFAETLDVRLIERIAKGRLEDAPYLLQRMEDFSIEPKDDKMWNLVLDSIRQRYNPINNAAQAFGIPMVTNAGDSLRLEGIACTDADGNVTESYPELYIDTDITRDKDNRQISKTSYQWAVYHEQQDKFSPSFALSCNILAALYNNKSNPKINRVLMQYKDKGNGYGWHAQNTIIDYASEEIIHYPSAADFSGAIAINAACQRITGSFSKATLQDSLLEKALGDSAHTRFVCQLTGLRDPSILVDIGKYFGKPAKLWFPWSRKNGKNYNDKRACWLGCYYDNFYLNSNDSLDDSDASRGVRKNFP